MARFILVCFGATVLIVALRRLRSYRLKERHMLFFTALGLPFLVLAVFPDLIGRIAQWMHIQYPTVSVLCVAAVMLLMVFELLTIVSLQERRISTLAQMVGILMQKQGLNEAPAAEIKAGNSPQNPQV